MKYTKVSEVPFDELEQVGISEQAFLNMPKNMLDRIMSGRVTPLMQMQWTKKDGTVIPMLGKLAMQRGEDNKMHLVVIPALKQGGMAHKLMEQMGLDQKDIQKLEKGELVVKEDKHERMYFQLDRETNNVIKLKEKDIMIPESIGDVKLGAEQKDRIREGKPVELDYENTKVTVGVDPNDVTGCRIIKGDLDDWKEQKLIEWDRSRPDVGGYWRCMENQWELEKHREIQQGISKDGSKTVDMEEETSIGMERKSSFGLKR